MNPALIRLGIVAAGAVASGLFDKKRRRKRKAKPARRRRRRVVRRRPKKRTKAQLRALRLRNLAKARRAIRRKR